jgi:hypothetical protein
VAAKFFHPMLSRTLQAAQTPEKSKSLLLLCFRKEDLA